MYHQRDGRELELEGTWRRRRRSHQELASPSPYTPHFESSAITRDTLHVLILKSFHKGVV